MREDKTPDQQGHKYARLEKEPTKADVIEHLLQGEIDAFLTGKKPDFEDCSTNYFYDERHVKAGNQLQKDAWNAAVEAIVSYINEKNMVQVDMIKRFKL